MRIAIRNTEKLVEVNGVPARVWLGMTESGIEVELLVTSIAVRNDQDCSQFAEELKEVCAPIDRTPIAFPLRMIL